MAVFLVLGLLVEGCGLGAEDVWFNVKVADNTPHAVLDQEYFGSPTMLKPGDSLLDHEYANEGVMPDRITSLSGQTLGCLPFQFTNTPPGTLEVKISQMVPCRHWAQGSTSLHDWPNPKY